MTASRRLSSPSCPPSSTTTPSPDCSRCSCRKVGQMLARAMMLEFAAFFSSFCPMSSMPLPSPDCSSRAPFDSKGLTLRASVELHEEGRPHCNLSVLSPYSISRALPKNAADARLLSIMENNTAEGRSQSLSNPKLPAIQQNFTARSHDSFWAASLHHHKRHVPIHF